MDVWLNKILLNDIEKRRKRNAFFFYFWSLKKPKQRPVYFKRK